MLLFRYFVSYTAYRKPSEKVLTRDLMAQEIKKRLIKPNVILAMLGAIVFSIALLGYRTSEQEYQLLTKFGADQWRSSKTP